MRVRGPIAPSIFKRHPITGEALKPVGVVNGKCVWPIMGGAPDGDEDDDDDDKDDDTGDSGSGDSKSGKEDTGDSGSGDDLSAEVERLRKRMAAADKRADEATQALKKIEDEKKDDLTKAQDRVTELESENETLKKQINDMRLQNAFLSANKHTWHDSEEALASAERNGYLEDVVDDDGKVDKVRLGKALDRLAKEKPFLVNSDSKKKDDDPDEPSGEPAGGRSDNVKDEKAKKEQLKKRFPVLSNR